MLFLKKLFFKEVYNELSELKEKMAINQDINSLLNKKVSVNIVSDIYDCNMRPILQKAIYNIHFILSKTQDYTSKEDHSLQTTLDHYRGNLDPDCILGYKIGSMQYSKNILERVKYVLSVYKFLIVIKEARSVFIKNNKDDVDIAKSFFLAELNILLKKCEHILDLYSEKYVLYIKKDIEDDEYKLVEDIADSALFKESQILSYAVLDADLLKERDKLKNENELIYELVSVSDKKFEMHFGPKNESDKSINTDVFIQHTFIESSYTHEWIDMLSSIVINTKFFIIDE